VHLLSARQVAARLSVSRPYVYTLIRDHGFPAPIKVGNKLAWSESEVSAWIEARAEARSNG